MIAVPAMSLPAVHLAQESSATVGNPAINISIFLGFVLVTLVVVDPGVQVHRHGGRLLRRRALLLRNPERAGHCR